MRINPSVLAGLLGLLVSQAALGWGPDGHRAIGEIAWHHLVPDAELEVERLLDAGHYDSLAEAGNWADTNARMFESYDDRSHHHYINIEPGANAVDMARDCPEGCVIAAIRDLQDSLRDRSKPKRRQVEAFLFLIHFIEDIHQPLHVIHPDMRGGNETRVRFLGRSVNLHQVWDSGLIDHRLERYGGSDRARSRRAEPWKQWAYHLRFALAPAEAAAWRQDLDPEAWARDLIAPSRELTFVVQQGQELGEEYYAAAIPLVESQIQRAGVRLAAVLNTLFAGD